MIILISAIILAIITGVIAAVIDGSYEKVLIGSMFAVSSFVLIWMPLCIFITPTIHITTGSGHHTGYVTAVDTSGVFYKTTVVYFKTDTQSAQEDKYCVVDSEIKTQLENASREKKNITINYDNFIHTSWRDCGGAAEIIRSIK